MKSHTRELERVICAGLRHDDILTRHCAQVQDEPGGEYAGDARREVSRAKGDWLQKELTEG